MSDERPKSDARQDFECLTRLYVREETSRFSPSKITPDAPFFPTDTEPMKDIKQRSRDFGATTRKPEIETPDL